MRCAAARRIALATSPTAKMCESEDAAAGIGQHAVVGLQAGRGGELVVGDEADADDGHRPTRRRW
jgi:hypothetical protein